VATPPPVPDTAELRRICQDPVRGATTLRHDPLYRALSIHVTRIALGLRLTANQVSLLSVVAGLIAAVALAQLTIPRLAVAVAGLQVFLLLDYVDGEVARYRRMASAEGRFFEQVCGNVVDPLLLLGLSYGVFRWTESPVWLALGVAAALATVYFRMVPVLINATLTNVYMGARDRGFGEATPEPEPEPRPETAWARRLRRIHPVYARFRFPYFHPNLLLILTLVAVADVIGLARFDTPAAAMITVAFYAVTTPVYAVWQVANVIHLRIVERRYRDLYVHGRSFVEHV